MSKVDERRSWALAITADVVIGAALAVLFAAAFWASVEWQFRTALFPRMVTVAGGVFALTLVVTRVVAPRRGGLATAEPAVLPVPGDDAAPNDGDGPDYVYATVGGRAWAGALAWLALFLVLLPLTGFFVAAGVFAFCYLRWSARRSWRLATAYAVVLPGAFYLLLEVLLSVPSPEGLF